MISLVLLGHFTGFAVCVCCVCVCVVCFFLFFQAEDGIRDLVRSRGLGDVYKRQAKRLRAASSAAISETISVVIGRYSPR